MSVWKKCSSVWFFVLDFKNYVKVNLRERFSFLSVHFCVCDLPLCIFCTVARLWARIRISFSPLASRQGLRQPKPQCCVQMLSLMYVCHKVKSVRNPDWKHLTDFKGQVKVRNSCLRYDFKLCSQSSRNRHRNKWAFLISRLNRWVFNLFLPNSEQFRVNPKKSRILWHLQSSPKSPSTEFFKASYLLPG